MQRFQELDLTAEALIFNDSTREEASVFSIETDIYIYIIYIDNIYIYIYIFIKCVSVFFYHRESEL
jgi:hypothetical protein